MRIETVDIIKDLVSNLNLKLKVSSVVDNGGGTFTLNTCNTLFLQKGTTLILGSDTYKIQAVENNTSVTIKGIVLPVIGTYNLPAPFFFHGSILQTNTEITPIKDSEKKTPMVYLKRPYTDRFAERGSALDREASVTLFFLTQAKFEEWRTLDHDINAIKPMRNLAYAFIDMLNGNSQIGKIEGFEITDRIKFGIVTDNGVSKSYWNDKLSGVELDITIPINKNYKCTC